MGKKQLKFLIGGIVILAAIAGLTAFAISNNAVYYYTVSELIDGGPRENVRVSGQLLAGTVEAGGVGDPLRFKIYDKGAEDNVLQVSYVGTIPDSFKDDPKTEVVVEGDFSQNGTFNADFMLAKCPTKYEAAAEEGQTMSGAKPGNE